MFNSVIDTVQTAQKTFVNTFVTNEEIAKPMVKPNAVRSKWLAMLSFSKGLNLKNWIRLMGLVKAIKRLLTINSEEM